MSGAVCVAGSAGAHEVPAVDVLKRWRNYYDYIADDIADKIKIAGSKITADDLDEIIKELSAVAAALRLEEAA